ncbi:MAG: hypothetical protein WBV53_13960 [Solirubrobacterales bacterium]
MKAVRLSIGAALSIAAVSMLASGGAFAANGAVVKAGDYSGFLRFKGNVSTTESVSFKVTHDRAKVKLLRLNPFVPNRCGSGGPPPVEVSKPAKIKAGAFKGTVKELATDGSVSVRGVVTGRFVRGGKVKGKVKSKLAIAPQYNATFAFTAQRGSG